MARGVYRLKKHQTESLEEQKPYPGEESQSKQDETGDDEGPICAFGMFWRRSDVSWEGSSTKLLGKQYKATVEADFGEQQGVYLLHDGREVVYVGRATSQRLGQRLKEHTKDRLEGRWDRFSWFGLNSVDENGALVDRADPIQLDLEGLVASMESLLIEGLEPRQNRKRGDGFEAIEFLQVVDPDVEKKRQEMLLDKMRQSL